MLDDNVFFQDSVRLVQRLIELEKAALGDRALPVEPHGFREPVELARRVPPHLRAVRELRPAGSLGALPPSRLPQLTEVLQPLLEPALEAFSLGLVEAGSLEALGQADRDRRRLLRCRERRRSPGRSRAPSSAGSERCASLWAPARRAVPAPLCGPRRRPCRRRCSWARARDRCSTGPAPARPRAIRGGRNASQAASAWLRACGAARPTSSLAKRTRRRAR